MLRFEDVLGKFMEHQMKEMFPEGDQFHQRRLLEEGLLEKEAPLLEELDALISQKRAECRNFIKSVPKEERRKISSCLKKLQTLEKNRKKEILTRDLLDWAISDEHGDRPVAAGLGEKNICLLRCGGRGYCTDGLLFPNVFPFLRSNRLHKSAPKRKKRNGSLSASEFVGGGVCPGIFNYRGEALYGQIHVK
jgi:hypothetical protein